MSLIEVRARALLVRVCSPKRYEVVSCSHLPRDVRRVCAVGTEVVKRFGETAPVACGSGSALEGPWSSALFRPARHPVHPSFPEELKRMDSKRLSLQQKLVRLRARMHDPEWRRYGRLLLAGKTKLNR